MASIQMDSLTTALVHAERDVAVAEHEAMASRIAERAARDKYRTVLRDAIAALTSELERVTQ